MNKKFNFSVAAVCMLLSFALISCADPAAANAVTANVSTADVSTVDVPTAKAPAEDAPTGNAPVTAAPPVDTPTVNTRQEYPIIDSHLHFLDFTQQSDGFEALVKKMDEANVTKAIVFGMPMAKQWDEHMEKSHLII